VRRGRRVRGLTTEIVLTSFSSEKKTLSFSFVAEKFDGGQDRDVLSRARTGRAGVSELHPVPEDRQVPGSDLRNRLRRSPLRNGDTTDARGSSSRPNVLGRRRRRYGLFYTATAWERRSTGTLDLQSQQNAENRTTWPS